MKIKHQLMLTHGLLVILALSIVLINILLYRGMGTDAAIINHAGKLRALSYHMGQLSNRIVYQAGEDDPAELRQVLQQRMTEFEDTLRMLGADSGIGIHHKEARARLTAIEKTWQDTLGPLYEEIRGSASAESACWELNGALDPFVGDVNDMVFGYSKYAGAKVLRGFIINAMLIVIIILVTAYSFLSTNQRVKRPMDALMRELKDLSFLDDEAVAGQKELDTDELSEMGHYFNMMMVDQLTKTYTRRAGLSKLGQLWQTGNGRPIKVSLCYIDINGLKEVNDRLGHRFGDELIVSAIECVKQEIRKEDFIIRMGGDEFLIVFNGIDAELSEQVWDRICRRYQTINAQEERAYAISISHGIVQYDEGEPPEIERLIERADDIMYLEKKYIKEDVKVEIVRGRPGL